MQLHVNQVLRTGRQLEGHVDVIQRFEQAGTLFLPVAPQQLSHLLKGFLHLLGVPQAQTGFTLQGTKNVHVPFGFARRKYPFGIHHGLVGNLHGFLGGNLGGPVKALTQQGPGQTNFDFELERRTTFTAESFPVRARFRHKFEGFPTILHGRTKGPNHEQGGGSVR